MKFACPKCQTQYSVADVKLPSDKALRFTCKKCGNIFRLKRKPKPGEAGAAVSPGEARTATSPGEATSRKPEAATRIADLREIMAVKKASASVGAAASDRPERAAPLSPFVQP
ncbi:MAG: zinc-ribbon domain-containing protein, partial [Acidobacteriota bacterium]